MDHPSIADLRSISAFADLNDEQMDWLANHFTVQSYGPGEIMARPGDPADYMVAILEGELHGRRADLGEDGPVFIAPTGRVTGKLPFSRMREFPATVRTVGNTRLARLYETDFPEMLAVIPQLGEILVGVLSDRIREFAKVDQNREKLAALGKLSAGLAHELNNPASAAQRAASTLREALEELAQTNTQLATCAITKEQRASLTSAESAILKRMDCDSVLDSLALSDREEEINEWFAEHKISNGWKIASSLADCGVDRASLENVSGITGPEMTGSALRRIAATCNVERLLREIENSTNRMTVLVRAIKEYSYMDRMKEQEIDIHRGLDTTLTMLSHSLKHGVNVHREYDTSLPRIFANGSELNQVWTNLIDNAITAMNCKGELRIRTARENDFLLVEITDDGPGIPEEIQGRIFEPFFTTKGIGEGTGLGLDFVYRILRRHHGDVRFTSRPGETRFQIRLPITQPPTHPTPAETTTDETVHAHQSNS